MWALCSLFILATAHAVGWNGHLPSKVPYVTSLRGGASSSCNSDESAVPQSVSKSISRRLAAWSLPSLDQRPWGRWKGSASKARGESKALPASSAAARNMPPAARARGFNSVMASIVGALLVGGGTISLSPQVVDASPFDPRPPPRSSRKPFFEGWFIRLVDHEQRLSFAVIIGSFRGRGSNDLDQHYVSLSYLHEPKGGILPAEADENPDDEEAPGSPDANRAGKVEGGADLAGAASPQARSAEIAQRFSRWIREQRLAVLRGFGAEGEEEEEEEEEEGKGARERTGGEEEIGDSDDAEAPSEGPSRRDDVGVGAAGEGNLRGDSFEGMDDQVAAGGAGGAGNETSSTEGGDESVQEKGGVLQQEGCVDIEGPGPAIDGERNPADAVGDDEDADIRSGLRGEDLQGVGIDVELVDAARERLSAPAKEATVRDVRVKGVGNEGEAALVSDFGTTAGGGSSGGGDRAMNDGDGGRSRVQEARGDLLSHPSGLRQDEPPLEKPCTAGGPSEGSFGGQEEPCELTHTFHAFPPPETVTITCRGEPVDSVPNPQAESSFTWEADGIGSFTVDGDTGRLAFQLPELSVAARFRNRQPWSQDQPNSAGPEGWLRRTGLLPLHYCVHSMGSEAGYSLKATSAPRAVVGRGRIHMEANYGESFPTGWVWAQGCSTTEGLCGNVFCDGELAGENEGPTAGKASSGEGKSKGGHGVEDSTETPARFVLTGGRFVIGPITTTSFVLAFRSEKHNWNFRSTDLDRFVVTVSRKKNLLTIVAKSWGDKRVLKADIQAPEGSFGSAIYVPTPEGFSNAPGCVESYAAVARFRLYTKGDKVEGDGVTRPLVLREEVEINLAALEFGGEYQET